MSLATLKKKSAAKYKNNSVGTGFALNGTHRNQGYVGQTSLSRTLIGSRMSGTALKGHGGNGGSYPTRVIKSPQTQCLENSKEIKESTLSTKGMIREKYQWAWRGGTHAPSKLSDSNNFNYSSYNTSKLKTGTLGSFDEAGCEILPGFVNAAPRSVFTYEIVTKLIDSYNHLYGNAILNPKRLYGYDFRQEYLDKDKSFKNVVVDGEPAFKDDVGTNVTVNEEGVIFSPNTPVALAFNRDSIQANITSLDFTDKHKQTLVVKFRVDSYDTQSPTGDARSIFHLTSNYADEADSHQNVEIFSLMYLRRNGIDQYDVGTVQEQLLNGPHHGKQQGTMAIRWGFTFDEDNAPFLNRNNVAYFHSQDQIELGEFYTIIISFELLNTEGENPTKNAGQIKVLKMFKSDVGTFDTVNPYEDPNKQFNWGGSSVIDISPENWANILYSGVYKENLFNDMMTKAGKLILGAQLDNLGQAVGYDGTGEDNNNLIEDAPVATVSHLYLFEDIFTEAEIPIWYNKYQLPTPVITTPTPFPIQQNLLVKRVGTDRLWTQNREDYNHIDQSQYLDRVKSKCTGEDQMLATRNTRGTPFVGFR
jgi:hypothetical protein